MKLFTTKFPFLLVAALLLLIAQNNFAQGVTTAAISGTVVDQSGSPLPSANIVAVHVPTGTQYGTTSRLNGKFNILGLKVGGPYKITVSYVGYKTETRDNIYLELGENLTLNFTMSTSEVKLSAVEVTAQKNPIISNDRTGSFQNVNAKQIQEVPTISRTFQSFAKLSPLFSGTSLSAAGRNNRYNNIQIDGTQYNDLFGLGSSGTPGGQTGSNPISLDAIQAFQVVIAPYDVRYGGFTGGGINAITRSGTNDFVGSVYGFGRNQALVGLSPDTNKTKLANFSEYQYGFRLGGPIMRDKLFFFTNLELTQHTTPLSNTALGPQGNAINQAWADSLQNILISKGFNPGSYALSNVEQPSTKFFLRFDYNLSNNNKLTLRNNFVHSYLDNLGNRSGTYSLSFDSYTYRITNNTNSTVLQLNSTFGNQMSNELTLGYTIIRDNRGPVGAALPEINVIMPGGFTMYAGTDRFSSANSLDQNIFELTDNFTYITGNHVLTFGTHNEFFSFKNLFIRSYWGYYQYRVNYLSQLSASMNNPSFYQRVLSRTSDPKPAAQFSVNQVGFYAQDEWSAMPNFKLTYGLRVDVPFFPTKPAQNDSVSHYFPEYNTSNIPNGNILWSPRVGFNWDINGEHITQLRGGVGIFTGRIPYVWMSNNYGNTGTSIAEVDGFAGTQFSPDPNNQPGVGAPGTGAPKFQSEIDLVNPNLKMPQLLRFDAAVDHQLPYGITGTVEALYSKNLNDMLYNEINLNPAIGTLPDGRPLYGGTNNGNHNFFGMYYLTNTSKGYQYNLSVQLQRNVARGISGNIGYTYGRSFDQNGVSSSQAQSQMNYNPIAIDPNNPALTTSDYEIRNRIFASVSYTHEFFTNAPTSISLYYNGQSGIPISYAVSGDVNNDGFWGNDLFYIPKNDADIEIGTVKNGVYSAASASTYASFDNFINNNAYLSSHRGAIAERNGSTYPWRNELDMKIVQTIPAFSKDHDFQISLDILNVLNLINSNWGWDVSGGYNTYNVVSFQGMDTKTVPGKSIPVYGFRAPGNNLPWNYDNFTSRWTMQLGVRYTF
ncbi:MAG: TonB-dependent receptor [Ignavibacteriaceae bacterium]